MTTREEKLQNLDTKKVNAWLDEHWKGNRACPICQDNHWGVGADLVEIRNFHGKSRLNPGPEAIYPLVAVVCDTCSYTMLFNAILIGLVEGKQ